MNFLHTAINNLAKGSVYQMSGEDYSGLDWHSENDFPPPTEEEIQAEILRLQAEYNETEYQRQRSSEYPDLKEFVDAYYWAQKGDNTKMNAYIVKCDTVKDKYPKPE